jgi:hypothetical protein
MPTLSEELFDVPWDDLDIVHLNTFFGDAGEEGLTWEAKGGIFAARIVRKAASGFGNSERGGFLILGINGDAASGWTVDGMRLSSQPELQVGQVLRAGVRPIPNHELKSWQISPDHFVVVVRIEPVSVPPAITSQGQVYERVTGETVPVDDPGRLATLFERGRIAEQRAEELADAGPSKVPTLDLVEREDLLEEVAFFVSGAGTAYRDDIGQRLFRAETDALLKRAAAELCGLPPDHHNVQIVRRQDATFAVAGNSPSGSFRTDVICAAFWDGSTSIESITRDSAVVRGSLVRQRVVPAWKVVTEILRALGGSGPIRLSVTLTASDRYVEGPLPTAVRIKRIILLDDPTEDEIQSVEREVRRAGGQEAHEA